MNATLWMTALLLACLLGGCAPAGKSLPMRIGGKDLNVELADTPEKRERGLQGRRSLGAARGMLFVFPEPRPLSFWSKNTRIPLSIAFLDDQGKITQIESLPPETTTPVTSRQFSRYALEVNAGWFDQNGIEVGDTLALERR